MNPFRNLDDLRAHQLQMMSPKTFIEDPLHTLQLTQLTCELNFEIDAKTAQTKTKNTKTLTKIAPKRMFNKLKRILITDRALKNLTLINHLNTTDTILPKINQLHKIEQSHYHHLDVYEHTQSMLTKTIELERNPKQ